MKISIIGTGNIGSTLAVGLTQAGHQICFGVKDPAADFKGKEMAEKLGIAYAAVPIAAAMADVIIICVPALSAGEVASQLGDVANKIIIDTMNSVGAKPSGFSNAGDAILANCNCKGVVKCFNSTGYENLANPKYTAGGIDMFVAGDDIHAKDVASKLALQLGFANCYDFGGNDKFFALEQLAFAWINLAIMQKHGRDIAFKIIKR